MSLVRLERGKLYTEWLMRGNEKAVLDLTFPKLAIANIVKLGCFEDENREWLRNVYSNPKQIGPVVGNPTIALTLSAQSSYQ